MSKKGFGSIYRRRTDNRWIGALDVGWRDGKRVRKTVSGRTKSEVEGKLKQLVAQQQAGELLPSKSVTVAAYLDEWLTLTVKAHRAHNTYLNYRSAVHNHLIPYIGKTTVQTLTGQQIQRALADMLADKQGVAAVRYAGMVLKTALNRAVKWGLISRNPCAGVELPRVRAKETAILSPDNARLFLSALKGHYYQNLLVVTLTLALRKSEALALQWSDIDLDAGTVQIQGQLLTIDGIPTRVAPKSLKSIRLLHLPAMALEALQRQRAVTSGQEYVFLTAQGRTVSHNRINYVLTDILTDAGLPRITIHGLRHTTATLLLEAGVPVHIVSHFLGHANVTITLNIYAHVLEHSKRNIAGEIDAIYR